MHHMSMKTYHKNILMSRIIIIFISPCKHGLDGRRWLIRVNCCHLSMGTWCWCTRTSAVPLPPNIPPLPPHNFCRSTPNQPLTLLLLKCPNDLHLPCHILNTQKTVQTLTEPSILQRNSTHPSHHHTLCPV